MTNFECVRGHTLFKNHEIGLLLHQPIFFAYQDLVLVTRIRSIVSKFIIAHVLTFAQRRLPRTAAAPNQMWTLIRRTAPFVGCKSCYSDHSTTRHFYTRTSNGVPTGLYGFDHLKSPNGFQRFVDDAIERLKKK